METTRPTLGSPGPHARATVRTLGPAPEKAPATLIMVHGRGATAESILGLYPELNVANLAAVAPQAVGQTWYPHSFLAPMEANQPYLDSALGRLASLVDELIGRGVRSEQIALLGFSQGTCLALEFVARNPRRYGAVMGLSGGLIGPPGTPRNYPGSLEGTPVFLGCSDPDAHIPFARVRETKAVFDAMGGATELRRYPDMPHTVNDDEVQACRMLLQNLVTK